MLLGKFKGRQVHFYQMDGCEFYVVRGSRYAAAMCWGCTINGCRRSCPAGHELQTGGHAGRRCAEKEGVCPR